MIIHETDALVQKVQYMEEALLAGGLKIDDSYSLSLLQTLINGYPFLPFTGSSLRPFCLVHILNDVIVNGRKSIIEFGSGLSTIMIGRLIRRNNCGATLMSVEHNDGWVSVLREILAHEQLDDIVSVIHAPLSDCKLPDVKNKWYDLDTLDKQIGDRMFDMMIVDGPPAWERGKEKARYPALPYILPHLHDKFSIYLDDANREGERSILQSWKREYGLEFTVTGGTLAYFYSREAFFTEPFSYYR